MLEILENSNIFIVFITQIISFNNYLLFDMKTYTKYFIAVQLLHWSIYNIIHTQEMDDNFGFVFAKVERHRTKHDGNHSSAIKYCYIWNMKKLDFFKKLLHFFWILQFSNRKTKWNNTDIYNESCVNLRERNTSDNLYEHMKCCTMIYLSWLKCGGHAIR